MAYVSSPLRHDETLRGSLAGRGTIASFAELRQDFADALRGLLCEREDVLMILAIRADRIASIDVPAAVLALTDRALFVLRESPRLGVRISYTPFSALGAIDVGHSALLGGLRFGFRSSVTAPQFTAFDLRGNAAGIVYNTLLDETKIFEFVRRLRELSAPSSLPR
ncbi:hypothetical protein WPS_35450 [Vulcanimicrobium alpinum]|uniref:Uncharacterized protein n=1 Tax=Vulcanimicrobium alpinum TaxID=3016050 RepID=A0AAN1XZM1_UNVUL|nr:hypothetical protein [Vulcanimicrobium alpinum]BDE08269.1 hypothetical protein WPS_35450 [Vulcanimicrobium alpinum]